MCINGYVRKRAYARARLLALEDRQKRLAVAAMSRFFHMT